MTENLIQETNETQPNRSNLIGVGSLIAGLFPIGSLFCAISYIIGFYAALFNGVEIPLPPIYAYFISILCGLFGGLVSIFLAVAAFFGETPRKVFPILGILSSIIGVVIVLLLGMPIILLLFSLGAA